MASSPPPPPTPTSPPSASNSENSATRSPPSMPPKVDDGDPKSSAPQVLDEMPHLTHFHEENMDKYKKYEADYTRRLMAKYFSKQNLYGGNIFDEKMTIDDEIILSSKWPCTRSFADPMNGFEEQSNVGSTSET